MWKPTPEAPRPRAAPRRYAALVAFAALVVGAGALFHDVLFPFVIAAFLAYLVAPVVDRLQGIPIRGGHLPRWGAVLVLYTAAGAVLALLAFTVGPAFAAEISRLAKALPELVHTAREVWLPSASAWVDAAVARTFGDAAGSPVFDLEAAVQQSLQQSFDLAYAHADDALVLSRKLVQGVIGGVTASVLTLMVTAFLLIDAPGILAFVRDLVPEEGRARFDGLIRAIDRGLAGVIRGQLTICVVNGILTYIGLALLDVPFSLVLALIAGVFSLIPIFGTILSSVPAVILGLTVGPWTGLLVLGWILLIHAIEANLLNPKILGTAARIHPVVVVFALLAGEHAFGLVGALLAVPVTSIVQTLFLHYRDSLEGQTDADAPPASEEPPRAITPR